MSATLVTGATGLVGFNIAHALLYREREVRCLVRDPDRARAVLPAGCALMRGDVTDADSVRAAMDGCDTVYHAAGLPEQWLRDAGTFDRVNVGGTRNLIAAALDLGVRKFVYTSTIDVFEAGHGDLFDESRLDPAPKPTAYERSKQEADRLVAQALDDGLPAVFLHPSGVYGPGPAGSPGLNNFFVDLVRGKIPMLLPGGVPVVYSRDVGEGHVRAEELADIGERFILSESYQDLPEIARTVAEVAGLAKTPRIMPVWVAKLVSGAGEGLARVIKRPPLIPRGQLHVLLWGAVPDNRRARERLSWAPTPFAEGVRKTLDHLKAAGRI